jgi:hypothetical protein
VTADIGIVYAFIQMGRCYIFALLFRVPPQQDVISTSMYYGTYFGEVCSGVAETTFLLTFCIDANGRIITIYITIISRWMSSNVFFWSKIINNGSNNTIRTNVPSFESHVLIWWIRKCTFDYIERKFLCLLYIKYGSVSTTM